VLAEGRWSLAAAARQDAPAALARRWRWYGRALAAVKASPAALHALGRAAELDRGDQETVLARGRVHLEDGDLLAALDQFRQARTLPGGGEHAAAWEGAVLRRTGQPEQAIALLQPLAERRPRDLRLHFELGLAYMALLRHELAARQFEAMLAVDPLDLAAHWNLMLCHRRLNQLPAARREEAIYHLLADDDLAAPPAGPAAARSPALQVHSLHELEGPAGP
jgi:tetratricopeptide (TPR) repeat protein